MTKRMVYNAAFLMMLVAGGSHAQDAPDERNAKTVREFLAACATSSYVEYGGCHGQYGGVFTVASISGDGPFCTGTPPIDILSVKGAEFDALVDSVIQWENAHPNILDMEVLAGTVTALKTMYPCPAGFHP